VHNVNVISKVDVDVITGVSVGVGTVPIRTVVIVEKIFDSVVRARAINTVRTNPGGVQTVEATVIA